VNKIFRPFRSILLGLLETGTLALALYGVARWLGPFGASAEPHQLATALVPAMAGAGFGFVRLVTSVPARKRFAPHRVLVVGTGRRAAAIEALMAGPLATRSAVVGYVGLGGEDIDIPRRRVIADADSLLACARENGVREIVVALEDLHAMPAQPLLEARMGGIKVTSYLSFWERETRRLDPGALDPGWLIFADGFHLAGATNRVLKRALDVTASLALLVLTLPVLAGAALAIRLGDRGPVLFRQQRVGRHGRLFDIYKFRTMRVDAEAHSGPCWAAERDARVTPIGRFMRATRIDELPQIVNVLRGEMSFVGPRPERPYFVERLAAEIPYYAERHRVRPGITGWAQVNHPYGASVEDARGKLSYDLYYIKNFSILLDLRIIARTVGTVLCSDGAR
jgi:sugar transferase (PEP-CTERM system associated)